MDKQTYMISQLTTLTGIPSPTGMTREITDYLLAELTRLGFKPQRTPKGTVMCCLGGSGHPLVLSAHVDALGAMVRSILPNGCLRYTQIGGYNDNAIENETVRIHTREGKVYTGTVQSVHTSSHVWGDITAEKRDDRSLQIVVDEMTWSKAETEALGIRPATVHPKATEHIPQIIALVQRLIDNGHAYAVNGDVYYRVSSFPGYGKLSGQSVEDREMGASERLDVETEKESPADFALWKAQKPGEPAWESPWGMGRPGWHIECSAMSMAYLGETFDIHCGGKDLLFPHHENEIAQSEGATGKPYVRYWMHNGFINVDNEKMSKSKGNFFTVRDIAKEYSLEAVRLFMLSAHYRSPINFSREQIEAANASLTRLYTARDQLLFLLKNAQDKPASPEESALLERLNTYEQRFDAAMDDDLNTADAIGAIFELVKDANVSLNADSSRQAVQATLDRLTGLCDILGLMQKKEDALPADIQQMVDERAQARKEKNWKRSDELRDAIKAAGYVLEDTPQGQKVRRSV